ncbi:MAG: ATP synthase subunit I [Gammaproteobacteria bacterium]|nr:ATP synthase subunit I [Gammaproteobacteria bacterium]
MTGIDKALAGKARRVVIVQLSMSLIVAAAFFGLSEAGLWKALAAGYGGLSSVVLALISIGGFKRANAIALSDPKQSMMILYIGAVVRFAAVIVLLGIGLGLLKLDALAVLIGFALAQASYLMSVRDRNAARSSD